jgi:hypothetical protein
MILTTHALAGAVIGKNVSNPAIVVIASLAVHFLMDSFRHGEYFDSRAANIKNSWRKVFLDLAIGFFLIASAIFIHPGKFGCQTIFNMALGIFFSMLPDGMTLLFWKFHRRWLEKITAFHGWAHRYDRFPRFSPERQWTLRNAVNDIVISTIAFLLLIFL